MQTSLLEVADIFRAAGAGYRAVQAGHLSLAQLKVMSAIQNCRTAALGGHVEGCDDCGHLRIAYNSCRNRHCPKCQGVAARTWLAEREADLLPVGYFHVVFTLPAEVADIAWQNKAVVYDLLFRAASETMITIAADSRHLGARIGITAVLHTWGSAMTHHPHVHMIVPGGGISPDGMRWIGARPAFLLPVRVPLKAVPPAFSYTAPRTACCRQARVLRPVKRPWRQACIRSPCRAGQKEAVAGLCQGTLCRTRSSAGLSLSLHASGRALEPAADRLRRGRRHLPLQGLPPYRSGAPASHDARYPRVHAPLPSACPATRLPPHPALRTACQHDTQGQCRSRPRTPKCIASSGTCRTGGTVRSSPAMSLLRRAHAYHRHFRTLEPTTCAASSVHANRDDAVVTRHGLPPSPTAAPSLRSPTRCACCTPDRAIRTHSDRRRSVLRSQPPIIRPSRSSPDASSRPQSPSGTRLNLKSP